LGAFVGIPLIRGARVFLGEEELATSMSRYVLERVEETRVETRSLP